MGYANALHPRTDTSSSGVATTFVWSRVLQQIAQLEVTLADRFDQHPDAKVVRSLPGLGTVLGARVTASSRTTRTAMPTPSLARTMPARHPSPRRRARARSSWPASPATGGWPTPATSGPSPPSARAQAPDRSTTSRAAPATRTTALCVRLPTGSSASPRLLAIRHALRRGGRQEPPGSSRCLTATGRGMSRSVLRSVGGGCDRTLRRLARVAPLGCSIDSRGPFAH